jgi:hypothetical protein
MSTASDYQITALSPKDVQCQSEARAEAAGDPPRFRCSVSGGAGMKLSHAILAMLLFGGAAQAQEPVTVKGHQLGETFAQFVAKEPAMQKALAACEDPAVDRFSVAAQFCQDSKMKTEFLAVRERNVAFKLGAIYGAQVVVRFNEGKVVLLAAALKASYSEIALEILKRTNQTGDETLTAVQNKMGAKWEVRTRTWHLGDTTIVLIDDPGSPETRTLSMYSQREQDLRQKQEQAKAHPLDD